MKVLVAYSASSQFNQTTRDYALAFQLIPNATVSYIHVTHGAVVLEDLTKFDVIILNYCARLCFPGYVTHTFLDKLEIFKGLKIISIQDEYDFVENTRSAWDRIQPDVVLTCVPDDQASEIYPKLRFPNTLLLKVLTGYVSKSLEKIDRTPVACRETTIGYRGRRLPNRYGRLGRCKAKIGDFVKEEAQKRGVKHVDISNSESDRIYGPDWYVWLAQCRCILGSESGSNIFDFDGSLQARNDHFESLSIEQRHQYKKEIDDLDQRYSMGQVSPRVFEAAALGTPMALYEGRYSDLLEPWRHYFPLHTDHSNIGEFFEFINDTSKLQAMADRAYSDLIGSGRYSYKSFAGELYDAMNITAGNLAFSRPSPSRPSDEKRGYIQTTLEPLKSLDEVAELQHLPIFVRIFSLRATPLFKFCLLITMHLFWCAVHKVASRGFGRVDIKFPDAYARLKKDHSVIDTAYVLRGVMRDVKKAMDKLGARYRKLFC